MITSNEQAIEVQQRRYASGKRGIAKAVRTWLKFSNPSQADRLLFINQLPVKWHKDKKEEEKEPKKEWSINLVPEWFLIRAINNYGERFWVHDAPKRKPIKLTSDMRSALAFQDFSECKRVRDDVVEYYNCTILRLVP